MPLKIKEYRDLAKSCRNLSALAVNDEARDAMIAMAEEYDRKADIREETIATVRAGGRVELPAPDAISRS